MKTLLPFLLVTLLCVGGVEFFYDAFKKKLQVPSSRLESSQVAVSDTAAEDTSLEEEFDYQIIVDRNLFGSNLEVVPEAGKKESSLEDLQTTMLDIVLLGTISGGSKGGKRAFIVDRSTNQQEIYQKGDAVQGAIIKDILRGKIILNYQGADEILHMSTEKDNSPKGGVAVNPSPRKKRILAAPSRKGDESGNGVQKAPPKRRFSFKKAEKTEPPQ